jgi:ABC-type polysaccharide/polyol phosphate transport system ATPase subunit
MNTKSPFLTLKNVSLDLPTSGRIRRSNPNERVGGRFVKKGLSHYVRALDDISLSLQAGNRIAVVGHNGAGKTTLLRMAAGIYSPTKGKRFVSGKVTCLLTSTLGLSPFMSGRENIKLACALYGLSKEETEAIRPEVEAFSELGSYLDLQTGTYSSGMRTRLGMSIITSLDPDILIIDEVFGAGDAEFSEKARYKLLGMLEKSRILIFSSHSESLLRQLCDTAILVEHGQIIGQGTIDDVLLQYKTIVI